jgi:hypothetical protein
VNQHVGKRDTQRRLKRRTNGYGLDLNSLLKVSRRRVIANFVREDFRLAEGVDEGGASSARSTCTTIQKKKAKTND